MITWAEFKAAVEAKLSVLEISGDVKIGYIDSGHFMSTADLIVEITAFDEKGKAKEICIWS